MSEIDTEEFFKHIETLKRPETLEEVKEVIANDYLTSMSVEVTANINALMMILIDKGFMTMEEYQKYYEDSKEAVITLTAQKFLNEYNKNK